MDTKETVSSDSNQSKSDDSNQSTSSPKTNDAPTESTLNGDATPFVPSEPSESGDSASADQTYGTFTLKIPLDSKIWKSISAQSPHSHRLNGTFSSGSGGGGGGGVGGGNGAAIPSTSASILNSARNSMHPHQYSKPWNIFPNLCMSRTLSIDVSANGLICIRRTDNIYIDISLDRAIKIACPTQKMLVCISDTAMNSVVFHPNGRICQNNTRIDLVAFDGSHQNNLLRYAKFWQKGISFMAKDVPLVYLVDEGGLRSSIDHFIHIRKDSAYDVFNNRANVRHTSNSYLFDEAVSAVQKSSYTRQLDGSEVIELMNQFRIINHNDGAISVERASKSCSVRINPRKAAITLTTLHIHATASMGKSPHLFLRQGDRRVHFDGSTFCVRNGGYSAGFDGKNQVTIFNKKSYPLNTYN